jgi:3-oxoacyl-[acyl-carrier-protein] synthase II
MALYIHGMANISPQATWSSSVLPSGIIAPEADKLEAVEPDHSQFIDAKHIRRMSRIIKMGVSAAAIALTNANVKVPDAIITGTSYGCLDDTGSFLSKMIENTEVALNPTPFIQSTHNTIGSQIALLLQCQGYNQTYSQGATSFESVLLDAVMQGAEEPEKNLLLGGVDEITLLSHTILRRFGKFRDTVNGEGAAFFVVNGKPGQAKVAIQNVTTFYKPKIKELKDGLKSFGADFEFVLLGSDGASTLLNEIPGLLSPGAVVANFKHLSGEYPTVSAFAVWLAASILQSQSIPEALQVTSKPKRMKSILILNQYLDTYFSAISVTAC